MRPYIYSKQSNLRSIIIVRKIAWGINSVLEYEIEKTTQKRSRVDLFLNGLSTIHFNLRKMLHILSVGNYFYFFSKLFSYLYLYSYSYSSRLFRDKKAIMILLDKHQLYSFNENMYKTQCECYNDDYYTVNMLIYHSPT